jgi:glycosyltransferase involved in cell wall biosynthesis
MQKILIVSERTNGFYKKYLTKLIYALQKQEVDLTLMIAGENNLEINVPLIENKEFSYFSSTNDEHRFLEVFKEAKNNNVTHIHFCRIIDPQRLYVAIEAAIIKLDFSVSFGVFGLSEYTRRPIYASYMEKLLKMDLVKSVLLHSIGPLFSEQFCYEKGFYQSKKISFIHDLIYENQKDYKLDSQDAKKLLKLEDKGKVVLFFGAYFFSKGPDILLQAAEELEDIVDLHFLFIGDTSTTSFDFKKEDYSKLTNVTFIDEFIEDQTAINYMIASDLVVLPYRKFYENNTSGVFVQSCLARTPLLVPDISPFKDVLEDYKLGFVFKCESIQSLKEQILIFYKSNSELTLSNYNKYVESITSWDIAAKLILFK